MLAPGDIWFHRDIWWLVVSPAQRPAGPYITCVRLTGNAGLLNQLNPAQSEGIYLSPDYTWRVK